MARLILLLAVICGVFTTAIHGLSRSDFYRTIFAKATYYSHTGPNGGNCAIHRPPSNYHGMIPVAISKHNYYGMCGACIEVRGKGIGAGRNPIKGKFRAYIMDKCPECPPNNIDLLAPGKDGKWQVSWKVIPCPSASFVSFHFEKAERYYWKLQPRGMSAPAKTVVVGNRPAKFTDDNHWEAHNSAGFKSPVKVVVYTVLGQKIVSYLSPHGGVVRGGRIYGGGKVAPKPRKKRFFPKPRHHRRPAPVWRPRRRARCVPKWWPCSGWKNRLGTSYCCNGWKCVWPSTKNFGGKRCEPPRRRFRPQRKRCYGAWQKCGDHKPFRTWNGRWYKGSHCCQYGYKCRWATARNFGAHRCEKVW